MKHKPGSTWIVRVDAAPKKPGEMYGKHTDISDADHPNTILDEVVIDNWCHIEGMTDRDYWMSIGGVHINVTVGDDGYATKVTVGGVEEPRDTTDVIFNP